ncbi:uncharacterized protein LOC101849577 [Aplysia californica]|uniref:Uncharacterized protein LOC101849577 n=1 Tax=Aplysia californica TaxID=6500 RepID=A0ABM1ADC4_APLCA|nr:uncharacterized protein LOC101849577 [Aplysia californica]
MGKKSKKTPANSGVTDVESMRDEFESNTEWNIRKRFLANNVDELPMERLVCLSRCFVNMTMYGCSYPQPVMIEVRERSQGLVESIEEEKQAEAKQNYADSFIRASDNYQREGRNGNFKNHKQTFLHLCSEGDIGGNMQTSGLGAGPGGSGPRKPMSMGIQFVKASEPPDSSLSKSENSLGGSQDRSQGNSAGYPAKNSGGPPSEPRPLLSLPTRGGFQAQQNPKHSNGNFTFNGGTGTPYRFGQPAAGRGGFAGRRGGYGSGSDFSNRGAQNSGPMGMDFSKVSEAKPLLSKEEYYKLWKVEKDQQLVKFRKLAHEVMALRTDRPNAKDKLNSAANRVPIRIEFNTEPVFAGKTTTHFICRVFIDTVTVGVGEGSKVKDAKTNAYEAALQAILMPYLRVVQLDPNSRELQSSKEEFKSKPPPPSKFPLARNVSKIAPSCRDSPQSAPAPGEIPSQHKESNVDVACLKRRYNEYKPLEDFVIVEPKIPIPDCTPAHTLRRSADFNHMLLEYEYFFKGESARCVLKIENQTLADVNAGSKVSAKNIAAAQGLKKLREMCWIIKTKQAVDSDTKISKDEMLNELNEMNETSDVIGNENIGHKLLQKMGWSGGGVGKDGSGIAEPVSLKSVLNREGLGLSATKGITEDFRRRVREVIENYAASERQEDLVFSSDFRLDERQIIHDECRKLNLRSKSRGKGRDRYLCVRRKRSAFELFDHIMSCGGETARYQLVPPGQDSEGGRPPGGAKNSPQQRIGQSESQNNQGGSMNDRQNSSQWWGNGPRGPQDGPFCHGPNSGGPRNGPNNGGGQWNGPNNGGGQWNGPNNGGGQWNGPNNSGPRTGPNNGSQWNSPNNGGPRNGPNNGGQWNGPNNGGSPGQWNGPNNGGSPGQWNGPNNGGSPGQWNGPNNGGSPGQWNGPNNGGGQWNGPNGPNNGGGQWNGPNSCGRGNGSNGGSQWSGPNGPNNGGGQWGGPNGPNNGGRRNGSNGGGQWSGPNNGGPRNIANGSGPGNGQGVGGPNGGGQLNGSSSGGPSNGGWRGQCMNVDNVQGQKPGHNMGGFHGQGQSQNVGNLQRQGQNVGHFQSQGQHVGNFQGQGPNTVNFQNQNQNMGNVQGQNRNMGNFQGHGPNIGNLQGQSHTMNNFQSQGQGQNMGNFHGQAPNANNVQGQTQSVESLPGQGQKMENFGGQSGSGFQGQNQTMGGFQGQEHNMGNFQGQDMAVCNFQGQGQTMGNFQGQGQTMGNFQGQGQTMGQWQSQGMGNAQWQNKTVVQNQGPSMNQWQGQNSTYYQGQNFPNTGYPQGQSQATASSGNFPTVSQGQVPGLMGTAVHNAQAGYNKSEGQLSSYYQASGQQSGGQSPQATGQTWAGGQGASGSGGSIQGSAVYYSTASGQNAGTFSTTNAYNATGGQFTGKEETHGGVAPAGHKKKKVKSSTGKSKSKDLNVSQGMGKKS